MSSEWLRVMLEEIARKKDEAQQAIAETQRRIDDGGKPSPQTDPAPEPAVRSE